MPVGPDLSYETFEISGTCNQGPASYKIGEYFEQEITPKKSIYKNRIYFSGVVLYHQKNLLKYQRLRAM